MRSKSILVFLFVLVVARVSSPSSSRCSSRLSSTGCLNVAHVYIVPVIVFYGAMALPFPLMLALAFFAGFLWDAMSVQVLDAHVEISFGWSILLYAVLAAIMHGLRPLFNRGRWEVHCVLSGVCTSLILLSQYLMISFRRGSLVFDREVWWQIGGPGLLAMLMAPLIFWSLHWIARLTNNPYLSREENVDEYAAL